MTCNRWYTAFQLVLRGPANAVGPGFKWKQSLLSLLVGWMFYTPFHAIFFSIPYRGAIPPKAPLIKLTGNIRFGFEPGIKAVLYACFVSDTGQGLKLQDPSGLEMIRSWQTRNPSRKIYVEGFLLDNGNGLFWPTYVAGANGEVLLSKDGQIKQLKMARNPFIRVLWMYIFSAPLWIISINHVRKNKNSLSV